MPKITIMSIMSILRPRTLACAAGVASLLLTLGCGSSHTEAASTVTYVPLRTGVYRGQNWQMYAFLDQDASPKDTLCLEIAPPGHPTSATRG
jgi:hypothetical protein